MGISISGPDGYLYLSLGENHDSGLAQRLDTPLGKILRIDAADGRAPPDNPFYDDGDPASGNDDRIWALGLRNSFDFAFHPGTGELFATENGPQCDDEINRIERGANYGWRPESTCDDPHDGFTPPLWRFADTIALTGIAFHRGSMFACAWNTGQLLRFNASDGAFRELTGFESWDGVPCQIDVTPGPDGALYLSDASSISRIVFPDPAPDVAVPGGRFYTQAGSGMGGFAIVDDADAAFWTAFQDFGGVDALGHPASRRFELGAFLYQATQASLLQRDPASGEVRLANVFDMLSAAGFDAWLDAYRQIPLSRDWVGDQGLPWADILARHLAILEPYPPLLARFQAVPDWIRRYGLPMGVHELPSVVVVRGQRAAFQLWKTDVPWARAGTVTIVLAGDLAKEVGLVPRRGAAARTGAVWGIIRRRGPGEIAMSLEAIASKLDQGIAELRAGTLQESTLAAIRDEVAAAGRARQDLLYLQAAGTDLHSQVIGMRMVCDGEQSDGPNDPDDWPYQSVLDAIRDGWRIIDFPNLALLLDESRTYAYGAEFVLEKIRSA